MSEKPKTFFLRAYSGEVSEWPLESLQQFADWVLRRPVSADKHDFGKAVLAVHYAMLGTRYDKPYEGLPGLHQAWSVGAAYLAVLGIRKTCQLTDFEDFDKAWQIGMPLWSERRFRAHHLYVEKSSYPKTGYIGALDGALSEIVAKLELTSEEAPDREESPDEAERWHEAVRDAEGSLEGEALLEAVKSNDYDVYDFTDWAGCLLLVRHHSAKTRTTPQTRDKPQTAIDALELLCDLGQSIEWVDTELSDKKILNEAIKRIKTTGALIYPDKITFPDTTKWHTCARLEGTSIEELESELRDYIRDRDYLEWWRVGDRANWLEDAGETVFEWGSRLIWGRETSGQSIKLDEVIFQIGYDKELLPGMQNSWTDPHALAKATLAHLVFARDE